MKRYLHLGSVLIDPNRAECAHRTVPVSMNMDFQSDPVIESFHIHCTLLGQQQALQLGDFFFTPEGLKPGPAIGSQKVFMLRAIKPLRQYVGTLNQRLSTLRHHALTAITNTTLGWELEAVLALFPLCDF